jgi:uroporphyrinogen decarboxylase
VIAPPHTGAERMLAAARGDLADATPAWFMRQAGSVLPAYRAMRERWSVLEIARSPDLCAAATLAAADAFGTDAAVMFADVLLPLGPMGIEFELATQGPVIANPVRTAEDVDRIRPLDPGTDAGFVLEAIRLVRAELGDARAVVGLAGGPFTLAAYLVEGGAARDYVRTRAFLHADPGAFGRLLDRLADATGAYLAAQVRAGAHLVQLFDTHAAQLDPETYARVVAPRTRRVFDAVAAAGSAPAIHFAIHAGALLPALAAAGGDVIGIDHRQSLAEARRTLGPDRPVQGNLDPARLLAGWDATRDGADAVLDAAGPRGHIFNLGHGVAPETDPGLLRALVDHVHERSQRT